MLSAIGGSSCCNQKSVYKRGEQQQQQQQQQQRGRYYCSASQLGVLRNKGVYRINGSRWKRLNLRIYTQILKEGNSVVEKYLSEKISIQPVTSGGRQQHQQCVTLKDIEPSEVLASFPSELAITAVDASNHQLIGSLCAERSDIVSLALWTMIERFEGPSSRWCDYFKNLPSRSNSPMLWDTAERKDYLTGSPIYTEAESRLITLTDEWNSLNLILKSDSQRYPQNAFCQRNFLSAFIEVLDSAIYLPSAGCFALLPPLVGVGRCGEETSCTVDYSPEDDTVSLISQKEYKAGEIVYFFDGRSRGEIFLNSGKIELDMANYLLLDASLIQTDKLYSAKCEILQSMGFSISEKFPIFENRMPSQLLSFLRLSRIQDSAQLAKVNFEEDVVISQINEYEVLQLIMADCRERLSAYKSSIEEDVKLLQQSLPEHQRLATELLLSEKQILQGTIDAVRTRLAPIRGIPTKSGNLTDANQDLVEIFQAIEELPKKPGKILGDFVSWAKGEHDPDWKK